MESRIFTPCNIYIGLWTLYYLQGLLYAGSSLLSKAVLLAFIIMSLYYAYVANSAYRVNNYMRALNILLIMFTIYGAEYIISDRVIYMNELLGRKVDEFTYLKKIYLSLLPVFPFFVFTKQGELTEKKIKKYIIYFFLIATFLYFYDKTKEMMTLKKDEVTNNSGYLFVGLLPLLSFYHKKKIRQYFLLGVIIVMVLLSMKRGAMLVLAISLIYFVYSSLKDSSPRNRFIIMFLTIIAIMGTAWYINHLIDTSPYFRLRMENTIDGLSSGRDVIYGKLFSHFINQSDPFYFLFGQGADTTVTVACTYAHNDWLEIAVNQGFIGIIIYLTYFYCFFLFWKNTSEQAEIHQSVGLLLIICFSTTLFSMSYNNMSFFACCALGYCLGEDGILENE